MIHKFKKVLKQVDRFNKILPAILTIITGKNRYLPDIVWSDKSWTHNVFRLYELVFWRRYGIKTEMSSKVFYDSNGKKKVAYACHSVESVFALMETGIRKMFEIRLPSMVWVPVLQPAGNLPSFNSPFLFAIAFDTVSNGTSISSSPITWSHTVTGSAPFLAVGMGARGPTNPTITGCTYNSVAATKARADQVSGGVSGLNESSVWFKGNPSTGANTISVSASGISPMVGGATSYSGAQSSNTADASNGLTGTTTGAKTFNVTTVADNCWVFGTGVIGGGTTPALTSATLTSRWSISNGAVNTQVGQDTNAPKTPAGAQAVGWTAGGTSSGSYCWAMTAASFAPGVATLQIQAGAYFVNQLIIV